MDALVAGLQTFVCARHAMTLTTRGCITLYNSANGPKRPDSWEGRAACRGCPIGSVHATGHAPSEVDRLRSELVKVCSRCGRQPDRMIWNTLCPSCDARQREAVRGRNAKGNRPALSKLLHTEHLAVSVGAATRIVHRAAVTSLTEVIIQQAKLANGVIAFGRRRVSWDAITHNSRWGAWANQGEMCLPSGWGEAPRQPRAMHIRARPPLGQLALAI